MSILENVAQELGVGINKPFRVYDGQVGYVATAVFKLDRDGCQLQVIPEDDDCIDPDTVLGGLIQGDLVPKRRLDDCPFCGCQDVLVRRMRFTMGGGQIQIKYTVYCPDCRAHGPLEESEDAAADGWNEK